MIAYIAQNTSNVLGLGISFADLVIGFIGLGGGTYAGARGAALSRMRLEDRRTLRDEHFPSLGGLNRNYDEAHDQLSTLIRIGLLVELLSWTERSMWERSLRKLPEANMAGIKLGRRGPFFEDHIHPEDIIGVDLRPLIEASNRLEEYVGLLIRPGSIIRRFGRRRLQLSQAIAGPWRV